MYDSSVNALLKLGHAELAQTIEFPLTMQQSLCD